MNQPWQHSRRQRSGSATLNCHVDSAWLRRVRRNHGTQLECHFSIGDPVGHVVRAYCFTGATANAITCSRPRK
jgi:hypothetical protein